MSAPSEGLTVLPCGDRAVLVEFDSAEHRRAWDTDLRAHPIAGVLDQVPGELTLLLTVADPADLPAVRQALAGRSEPRRDGPAVPGRTTVIGVHYDGPDLADVAALLGLTPDEVVGRHTGQLWRVDFAGFAPGFGYLIGDHDDLVVPRRAEPRTAVPAGAVGLAGRYSGVYPRESPGGWQLIGRTETEMWLPDRDPPAVLHPGAVVRFEALS